MQQLIIYIIKVIIISGMLLLYYYISLRNKRFHYYNRFYLLLTIVISLLLPALHLHWFLFNNSSPDTIKIYQLIYSGRGEDVLIHSRATFNYQNFIALLFITTCVLMLSHLVISIIKIYQLKKVYPLNKFDGFDFIHTDLQSAPFSFFKNIFWRNDIDVNTDNGKQILQHEITHIKQKHSLDKICMQFILCIFWMNPFFWSLKKELYLIHEFIADETAVNANDAASFAQMLLAAKYGKFEFLPAQSIFYSSIKRRILMLTTSKKTQFSYLRRIIVLPLIATIVCLCAFTVNTQNTNFAKQNIIAAKSFKLVVDAGHGGKDDGAVGNGISEKNIALKIAKKIKDLSSQYNIDVILTRDDDVYMSPAAKSNFANAQNADAFISVHINAADKNRISNSGFEVVLPKNNTALLNKSQVLGSAIIQNLQPYFNVTQALMQRQVGIWVLDQSKIPSALIECGYMTNANDVAVLKDDKKIELMARNILQGVAAYSNNNINKSELYKIERNDNAGIINDTALPPAPLYVLDGKIIDKAEFDRVSSKSENILSINVLKDKSATDKYGDAGKNGVIEITSKKDKNINSQNNISKSDIIQDISTKPIFNSAQKEPQFPGGINGWKKFLEANLNADVPAKKHAPKGIYTVTLSFLIDEHGKVSNIEALTNPGYGTAEEAKRVIAKVPDWIPAVQNGQKVTYIEKQNISFGVN